MRRRGQAILLVTFAAVALFSILGLAVDLGWSYFMKKAAQNAADSAAIAAAKAALASVGEAGDFVCGSTVYCTAGTMCASPVPSAPANTTDHGCLYAKANGFEPGGSRTVRMEAGTGVPPMAPGVNPSYWVTARITQTIPQLFAAMISPEGHVGASATAAVVDLSVYGSLVLLNRENDCIAMENVNQLTCGVNLLVSANDNQGRFALQADGGIFMSSQKNGGDVDGRYAGENTGGGTVKAPFSYVRGVGGYKLSGSSQWIARPEHGGADANFLDPMRGKGQPKAPAGLADHPVPGGAIVGTDDPNSPLVLQPGAYFATNAEATAATGDPIEIRGQVRFSSGSGTFGSYAFFGGVRVTNNGTAVTFEPGVYVLAGVKNGAPLFQANANSSLKDLTSAYGPNTDGGELFIFTDASYRGQGEQLPVPALVQPLVDQLGHGPAGFQAGNSAQVAINLHGLNKNSTTVPDYLDAFAPVLLWQDQRNSVVKYDANGNLDTSCGIPDGCPNTLANPGSPELVLQGSAEVHFYGAIYQPRGAWTTISGAGDYQVPVQVVAGALKVQGNANFSMVQPTTPISRRTVALVQ